jgi:hypothetical protein
MMRKTAAASVASALLVTVSPAPAQAVLGCSADAICFYKSNYSTAYPIINHDDSDTSPGECHPVPVSMRNQIVYIRNWTDHNWLVYTNGTCSGAAGTIWANTSGNMAGTWYMSIDSYKRVG